MDRNDRKIIRQIVWEWMDTTDKIWIIAFIILSLGFIILGVILAIVIDGDAITKLVNFFLPSFFGCFIMLFAILIWDSASCWWIPYELVEAELVKRKKEEEKTNEER